LPNSETGPPLPWVVPAMTVRRKLLLSLVAGSVLLLALLAGVILYYYTHPANVKSLVERSLSRATNTQVSIAALSYSLEPIRIRATGIVLKPFAEGEGLQMRIPRLDADMALEGPFGHRTLVIESLTVEDVSASLSGQVRLPPAAPASSFFSRAAKRLLQVFLFKDIRVRAVEVTGGPLTARLPDQEVEVGELRATGADDRGIEISFAARLLSPSEQISVRAPRVVITLDQVQSLAEPQLSSVLTARGATFESPELTATPVDLTGQLTYDHKQRELSFAGVELTARGHTLPRQAGGKPFPVNLRLTATGRFSLEDSRLEVPALHVSLEDVAEVKGAVHARLGPETRIELRVEEGSVFPSAMLAFLAQEEGQGRAPFNFEGPVGFSGEVSGLKEAGRWNFACDLQGRLSGNRFSYRTPGLRLDSMVSADFRAKGVLPFPEVSLSLEADRASFFGRGLELKTFSSQLSLHGRYPAFSLENLTARVPLAALTIGNRRVPVKDIRVRARGCRLDAEKRELSLPEIRFDSSLIRNLAISGEVGKGRVNVALKGNDVNLAGLARGLGLLPADWQTAGRDSIQIGVNRDEGGAVSFKAGAEEKDFSFQSKDGRSVGEKVSMRAELQGGRKSGESALAAVASLKIDKGEILYDQFYVDLSKNGFFFSGKARYHAGKELLELSDARVELNQVLGLTAAGKLLLGPGVPTVRLSVDLPETHLEPAFHQFVTEPFKNTSPFLAGLSVAGTISTHIDITGTGNGLDVTGRAGWHEGSLSSSDDNLAFKGLDLDLPIWYRTEAGGAGSEPLKGTLSIQSMAVPLLPEQPLLLHLDAEPNGLSVNTPTVLSLPAGKVEVGPVSARNIFGDRVIVEASLSVKDVAVAPLLANLWPQPLKGTINGRLDPIVIRGGSLTSSGELEVRAFGGKILVSKVDLSGEEGPVPVVRLDVELDNLDLAMLTAGTSFGKIEGILGGHIRDLEIAGAQPQAFDLLLETVKKRGTPQEISVRAVDNIARIGGSQSPFIGFAKMFASLFKDFPYREIGVHATLENDIFRINGTIKEGGKEYLVRRGALWGVDVINQSPDNRISFKDMVKRIKRITESSGGPVIQ
jgi:hypothetical protein